ncbi:MAG: hypothetical protein AMS27_05775 [Bacteroides sp. SM23_62_1]|nr:MAG: hypothetical protein AMS27_05775 [Bacteroides sp. SM23_62_1]
MYLKRLFLLFLSGFLFFSCEEYEDAIDPYSLGEWKTFTTRDGIGGNEIWTMLADSKGNIWIATLDNGVTRYDGNSWKTWNTSNGLIDNTVTAIEEDINGDMWFGTSSGFSILNASGFNNYTGIGGNIWQVRSLKQADNGSMWIGTWGNGFFEVKSSGIISYYNDTWEETNYVNCIDQDMQGNIWVGTNVGVYRVRPSNVDFFTVSDGLTTSTVKSLMADSWGHVWFGPDDQENITRYDGQKFSPISLYNGMPQNYVTSFLEDTQGNIWIGMISNGVIKYDGTIMRSYFNNDGLASNTITAIVQDTNGNIWFASYEDGITRYKPGFDD